MQVNFWMPFRLISLWSPLYILVVLFVSNEKVHLTIREVLRRKCKFLQKSTDFHQVNDELHHCGTISQSWYCDLPYWKCHNVSSYRHSELQHNIIIDSWDWRLVLGDSCGDDRHSSVLVWYLVRDNCHISTSNLLTSSFFSCIHFKTYFRAVVVVGEGSWCSIRLKLLLFLMWEIFLRASMVNIKSLGFCA